MTELVSEGRAARPIDHARQGLRVRVNQQLRGIEAVAAWRVIGAIHAVAVKLPGGAPWKIDVPGVTRTLPDGNDAARCGGFRRVKQAKVNALRIFGIEGEIHAFPVPSGAEGRRSAGPNFKYHELQQLPIRRADDI